MMKISDSVNQRSAVSEVAGKDDRKVAENKQGSFQSQIKRIEGENQEEHIKKLASLIIEQGEKLGDKIDIRELKIYKQRITDFLNEAVGSSHKFSKESFLDRRGRHRVFATIKKINTQVDKLTGEVLSTEKDNISILRRLDDIRGLIMDILLQQQAMGQGQQLQVLESSSSFGFYEGEGFQVGFDEIIGQKEVIENLINSVRNNKVAHASIFTGPKGIGKRTVAKAFAKVLLCSEGEKGKACGTCICCKMVENDSNPDFHVIRAEGNSIGVEDVRKIQSEIVIKPLYSNRKVYLIEDADKMTVQAQNCILKTLEEPPPYAVLILTTSNYNAILETIRSRAVKYNLKKNSDEEITNILAARFGAGIDNIDFITSYSEGIPGTAIDLAGSEEISEFRQRALDIVLQLRRTNLSDIFDIYNFFDINKASVDIILDIMLMMYRDIIIAKKTGNGNVLINSDKKDIILSNVQNFSITKLISNIEEIEKTRKNIKQNANFQLSIEVMLMKLQEE